MKIVAAVVAILLLVLILRATSRGAELSDEAALTDDAVRELLLRGRKIQAIKLYRKLHRVDLKAAKEAVERLAATTPPSP